MATEDNDDSRSVALYWDFENLHAGLMEAKYGEGAYARKDNRFKVQEPLIDVQALVELGASFGPVAINRAYGSWRAGPSGPVAQGARARRPRDRDTGMNREELEHIIRASADVTDHYECCR